MICIGARWSELCSLFLQHKLLYQMILVQKITYPFVFSVRPWCLKIVWSW